MEGLSATLLSKTDHLERISSAPLSFSERVLASCMIAREHLEAGDYEVGCATLSGWWKLGDWPAQAGLGNRASAELLLTAGILSGWIASTRQVHGEQKQAAGLLNGAIALFEQLGDRVKALEARIELAGCYYREGLFDLAKSTLASSLTELPETELELRAIALIRLASF